MNLRPEACALGGQKAALLIDADNFSDPVAIETAWAQLQAWAGRVSVCRAYGGAAKLQTLAAVWRGVGARAFANLSLDKNTTDAALVADAVALHFQQDVRMFAIASGDADFAPLAVRLREWGCEVWCFSMNGIVFQGAEVYYDRVVRFSPAASAPAPVVVPVLPAAVSVMPLAPSKPLSVVPEAAPKVAQPKSLPHSVVPDVVQHILTAVPGLRDGQQLLSQIVPVLRQKEILGKTAKSTVFFARHAAYFRLIPEQQPTYLVYQPPRAESPVPASASEAAPVSKSSAASGSPPVVLSWPVVAGRRGAPPLLAELHGLRSVLTQLARRRVTVADVLLAIPEMCPGQPCALSSVAGRLREKGLLRVCDSALRVLERHPKAFVVNLGVAPPTVKYLP